SAPRERPLMIGSVKTNLGHLEAAAGMAGLIKAVEAVRSGVVPPHLHFAAPNPHIAWEEYPLTVPVTAPPFPGGVTPRAGISSFGFSGTNAHVIVEAPPERAPTAHAARDAHILTLSAPQEGGLRALAARYAAHLRRSTDAFGDTCATANIGRTAFAHRLAIVARDAREAADRLDAWIAGRDTDGVWHGRADARSAAVANGTDAGSDALAALARMFVTGAQPDWRAVHGEYTRTTLPTYPFQRRPFWFTKRPRSDAAQMTPPAETHGDPDAGWDDALAAGRERAALA